MIPDWILKTENLSFRYGSHEVLREVSLEVPKKGITVISGPSGSGKTSLLLVFSLLYHEMAQKPEVSGNVFFRETDFLQQNLLKLQANFEILRRKVVYLAQTPCMLPVSILENAAFALKMQGVSKKNSHEKAEAVLDQVHLLPEIKERLFQSAEKLSGGQKQKLALARALVLNPPVLLLDEPTSSLDEMNKLKIESLLKELSRERAVVLVTHDQSQALRLADRKYQFQKGGFFLS